MKPTLSYNLTRPYPYKWFLPTVIVIGLFLAIFVSLLNYAVNGFYLSNEYTSDLNGTVSRRDWTQRGVFSILAKVTTSCQSTNLAVNAQFYTDKLSLPYTITAIWQQKEGRAAPIPGLPYANNTLEDCVVSNILIDLESEHRTAEQKGWLGWGVKALALVSCSVTGPLGRTTLNMTTSYEYITSKIGLGIPYTFLQRDPEERASLWWGESLLSWYWLDLAQTTNNNSVMESDGKTAHFVQGSMIFTPSNVSDISSHGFFNVGYHLLADDGDGVQFVGYSQSSLADNIKDQTFPNIWGPADTFAKVFYSTILADLGSNASANILTEPTLLQNLSDYKNMPDVTTRWLSFGPATQGYAQSQNSTGPLGIKPSTIYAQYLCQIPSKKPAGTLFIALLVADLVILSALWKITTWAMALWLDYRDPGAYYCVGCLAKEEGGGDRKGFANQVHRDDSSVSLKLMAQPEARPRLQTRHTSSESRQPLFYMEQGV